VLFFLFLFFKQHAAGSSYITSPQEAEPQLSASFPTFRIPCPSYELQASADLVKETGKVGMPYIDFFTSKCIDAPLDATLTSAGVFLIMILLQTLFLL
jgi:hypothetical protein